MLGAVVPFTVLGRPAESGALHDPATADLNRAGLLLARWNRLHAVRSLLSLAALLLFVSQLG